MYAWNKNEKGINAVRCTSGILTVGEDLSTHVELTMLYANAVTGNSYGTCKTPEDLLSPETMQALDEFLKLAERDFGMVASGQREIQDPYSQEESPEQKAALHMPLGGD